METMIKLEATYTGNSVMLGEAEYDITLPKDRINQYLALMNSMQKDYLVDCLCNIEFYQKNIPNYPEHQISNYCLYLGTFKHFDLYSYMNGIMYSTAIVYGSACNEYMSGWLSLKETREEYNELFKRECACHLISDNTMLEIGQAIVADIGEKENMNIIKQLRMKNE